jgi:uncharacterized membrane protein
VLASCITKVSCYETKIQYKNVDKNGYFRIYVIGDNQTYSEEHSYSGVIDNTQNISKIKISETYIDKIRIDIDETEEISIDKLDIYYYGIKLREISANEIFNDIFAENDCNVKLTDNALIMKSMGADSFISCDIIDVKMPILCRILIVLISLLVSMAIYKLIQKVRILPDIYREKLFSHFAFIVAVCCVMVANIFVIKAVNGKIMESYSIKTSENKQIILDKEGISGKFEAMQANISNLVIETTQDSDLKANIEICIYTDNEIIYDMIAMVDDIDINGSELKIDVSDIDFNQYEDYILQINSFDDGNSVICICDSNSELMITQNYEFKYKSIFYTVIAIIDIVFLIFLSLLFIGKYIDGVIAMFSVFLGIIMCFIIVPCNMDDEYRHFLRAYDIAQGNIIEGLVDYDEQNVTGNVIDIYAGGRIVASNVPKWVYDLKFVDESFNYKERSYYAELNFYGCMNKVLEIIRQNEGDEKDYYGVTTATWTLTPFSYLPQVSMILLGMLFGVDNIFIYYLARMGNVIVASFIFYIILKLSRNHKPLLCLIHFMPSLVLLRSSCSTDGLLNVLILLDITYVIYLKEEHKQIGIKDILILSLITSYIAIMKLPYAFVVCLLIMIKRENKIDNKFVICMKSFSYRIMLPLLCIGVGYIIYNKLTIVMTSKVQNELNDSALESGLLSDAHINYLLDNTGKVINMIIKELFNPSRSINAIGGNYAGMYGKVYLVVIIIAAVLSLKCFEWYERIYFWLVYLGLSAIILFVGYTFASPDIGYIWGVGFRYYIPIVVLPALSVSFGNRTIHKYLEIFIPIFVVTGNVLYAFLMLKKYWL